MPPQISTMCAMRSSTNFSVVSTLAMRWPVRSWKLQASKMRSTLSWMSSASDCSCSRLRLADKRIGGVFDVFGGAQDLLGRAFRAFHHRVELAGDARGRRPERIDVQRGDLLLGAVEREMDRVGLGLERAKLVGAVVRDIRAGFRAAALDQVMQRLQFGEDLLPVGRRDGNALERAGGHADRHRLLDAKDLALDRHLCASPLRPIYADALNVGFIAVRNARRCAPRDETID